MEYDLGIDLDMVAGHGKLRGGQVVESADGAVRDAIHDGAIGDGLIILTHGLEIAADLFGEYPHLGGAFGGVAAGQDLVGACPGDFEYEADLAAHLAFKVRGEFVGGGGFAGAVGA